MTRRPDLDTALGQFVQTVPALLEARAGASPESPALWALGDSSTWRSTTWLQFSEAVASTARGLRALGLRRGDRMGIIAPSSPDWDMAQFAAMALGGVVVGLDPHDTGERLAQMAAQCGLTGVVAQDEALIAKLGAECRAGLRFAVTTATPGTADCVALDELARIGGTGSGVDSDAIRPDDTALIVFTSGTTGAPKGIAYTHGQVCGAVASILRAFPDIGPGSRLVCWLPLSNLFQRIINLCAVGRGAQTFYIEDPRAVMQHAAAISPHLFIGVPRFYEKLYAGIRETIDAMPAWQRAIVRWAIGTVERQVHAVRTGVAPAGLDTLSAAVAERFVLRRIRSVLGRDLRFLISGSAPMPVLLLERFQALGFLVLEAYGMSESIVPIAANRPDRYRFGSVGLPLDRSEVRLAADGELLLRGPGVFTGYLGEPVGTHTLDADGFLASGDYASIDAEGFVTLRGRKSDSFKTSTGRRIAPAIVEGHLRQISYVDHAVVFGANRAFLVAVVAVAEAAFRHRLGDSAMGADPESTALAVRSDIESALGDLPGYLRPAGVLLAVRQFSIAEGQITPNLKVRRANVEINFGEGLDALFDAVERGHGAPFALLREDGAMLLLST